MENEVTSSPILEAAPPPNSSLLKKFLISLGVTLVYLFVCLCVYIFLGFMSWSGGWNYINFGENSFIGGVIGALLPLPFIIIRIFSQGVWAKLLLAGVILLSIFLVFHTILNTKKSINVHKNNKSVEKKMMIRLHESPVME